MARQFTGDVVFGKTVTVRVRDTDRYGRIVGEVVIGGLNLNRELVRAGQSHSISGHDHVL